jgi:hypothetical protein
MSQIKTSKKDQMMSDYAVPVIKKVSKLFGKDIDKQKQKFLATQRLQMEQEARLSEKRMKQREADKQKFMENMKKEEDDSDSDKDNSFASVSTIQDNVFDPDTYMNGGKKKKTKRIVKKTTKKVTKQTTRKVTKKSKKPLKKTTKKRKVQKGSGLMSIIQKSKPKTGPLMIKETSSGKLKLTRVL